MKNIIKLFLFVGILFVPAIVFAQGSGSTQPQPRPPVNNRGIQNDRNFVVTRSAKGTVVKIKDGILIIKTGDDDDDEMRIALTKETKFKLGKKDLDADELDGSLFEEGRKVKITYQPIRNNPDIDKVAVLVRFEEVKNSKKKPTIG